MISLSTRNPTPLTGHSLRAHSLLLAEHISTTPQKNVNHVVLSTSNNRTRISVPLEVHWCMFEFCMRFEIKFNVPLYLFRSHDQHMPHSRRFLCVVSVAVHHDCMSGAPFT